MTEQTHIDFIQVENAIKEGLKYLWSLNNMGSWQGFPTMAGTSDIWVTGFVLAHISSLSQRTPAMDKAYEFLLSSQHSVGGWSYSRCVPPDADSTAWCLVALANFSSVKEEVLRKATSFLWEHYSGKGLATYMPSSGIQQFIGAPSEDYLVGWYDSHPDVSMAAVLADLQHIQVPAVLRWVTSRQSSEGFFDAYWWRGPYYTTALLLRALSLSKRSLTRSTKTALAAGLKKKQLANGAYGIGPTTTPDIFNTALALECLVHIDLETIEEAREACGHALLKAQNEDGSWAGGHILRLPAPNVTDPGTVPSWNNPDGGGNSFVEDKAGLFATAMACHALALWREKTLVSQRTPDSKNGQG